MIARVLLALGGATLAVALAAEGPGATMYGGTVRAYSGSGEVGLVLPMSSVTNALGNVRPRLPPLPPTTSPPLSLPAGSGFRAVDATWWPGSNGRVRRAHPPLWTVRFLTREPVSCAAATPAPPGHAAAAASCDPRAGRRFSPLAGWPSGLAGATVNVFRSGTRTTALELAVTRQMLRERRGFSLPLPRGVGLSGRLTATYDAASQSYRFALGSAQ